MLDGGVVTIPGVELVKAGNWASAQSGYVPVDDADLESMVAAAQDAEVDAAPVKVGHIDPRFDGEPALGWLSNVRKVGSTVVADLTGVPAKMRDTIEHAFRRRSVEIAWGVKTPSGKQYKAALSGLALLGVTAPAVKGLADVTSRYAGPQNAADNRGHVIVDSALSADSGDLSTFSVHADPDAPIPSLEGPVTDEQVRTLLGLPADMQVTDQLRKAAQLMSDTPPSSAPAAPPAAPAPTNPTPAEPATPAPADPSQPAPTVPPAVEPAAPAAAVTAPTTSVDSAALAALQAQAAQGANAMRILDEQERERVLTAALSAGKIAPASVDAYRKLWDTDRTQTTALLSGLPAVFSTVTNFSASPGAPVTPSEDGYSESQWDAFASSLGMRG